ncbi:hypothetical protein, partial [Enterocloster sp.]|uniref:hypothetical protein n=1 Tax=Enterocloster sp. TaxID=2719315 RepID=UPI00284B8EC1
WIIKALCTCFAHFNAFDPIFAHKTIIFAHVLVQSGPFTSKKTDYILHIHSLFRYFADNSRGIPARLSPARLGIKLA